MSSAKRVAHAVVATNTSRQYSRVAIISWVNRTLDTDVAKIEDLCSGAAYCNLMDILYPKLVKMCRVKFVCNQPTEYINNFRVLQLSFNELEVKAPMDIEQLVKGRFQENYAFAQWFKLFYESNFESVPDGYSPLAARGFMPIAIGQSMRAPLPSPCPQPSTETKKLMNGKQPQPEQSPSRSSGERPSDASQEQILNISKNLYALSPRSRRTFTVKTHQAVKSNEEQAEASEAEEHTAKDLTPYTLKECSKAGTAETSGVDTSNASKALREDAPIIQENHTSKAQRKETPKRVYTSNIPSPRGGTSKALRENSTQGGTSKAQEIYGSEVDREDRKAFNSKSSGTKSESYKFRARIFEMEPNKLVGPVNGSESPAKTPREIASTSKEEPSTSNKNVSKFTDTDDLLDMIEPLGLPRIKKLPYLILPIPDNISPRANVNFVLEKVPLAEAKKEQSSKLFRIFDVVLSKK